VTSTYSEVLRLAEFMAESPKPDQSVIVISDPYHMRRARWTYRHVLGASVDIQMAPVPFDLTPYRPRWWEDEASDRYVKDEYLKLVYYIARYQLAFGPARGWLASLDRE
jgi:uncharacterized SAM-binding protein YcdF (DUF218 family)